MPQLDAADLDGMFDPEDGLAEDAAWSPLAGGGPFTIQGYFDKRYTGVDIGEMRAGGREILFHVRDDQTVGIKRNDSIVIGGVTYKIAEHEPNGTGITELRLRS